MRQQISGFVEETTAVIFAFNVVNNKKMLFLICKLGAQQEIVHYLQGIDNSNRVNQNSWYQNNKNNASLVIPRYIYIYIYIYIYMSLIQKSDTTRPL